MGDQDKAAGRALDAYLAAAARTGDHKALALLFKRWNPRLTAHAWRLLGDREQAGDAVQEAWVEIVRGLVRLADTDAFAAWAYRITSRRCAKAINRAVRDRRTAEALQIDEAAAAPQEPHTARLRQAIDALPLDQRAAIALFYLEDMSVAEVAVALAVPAGTVKTRLMHARHKLRAALEGDA
jgi:RNA polymerase sigma-70 factor (ECF subfamily)